VRERFVNLLANPAADDRKMLAGALFAALADREPAPPEALRNSDLSPEWARKLSAPFVLDPGYGTRCSTVLTISHDDELAMIERRFDAQGNPTGETEYALNAAGP